MKIAQHPSDTCKLAISIEGNCHKRDLFSNNRSSATGQATSTHDMSSHLKVYACRQAITLCSGCEEACIFDNPGPFQYTLKQGRCEGQTPLPLCTHLCTEANSSPSTSAASCMSDSPNPPDDNAPSASRSSAGDTAQPPCIASETLKVRPISLCLLKMRKLDDSVANASRSCVAQPPCTAQLTHDENSKLQRAGDTALPPVNS